MTLYEIISDIHAINEDLKKFEQKYGVLSDTFYEWYCRGEEPEDDNWVLDFSMWAGLYEIKLEREQMYHELIQKQVLPLVMHKAASLEFA
jgi:hypothetical protein